MSNYFEYYHIHSKDRINGTPSKCQIQLNNLNKIDAYYIDQIIIPYTWYPFRTGINTAIQFTFGGVSYTTNIDEGNYSSINDFITELKGKMNGAVNNQNNTFNITYSSRTGLLTISTVNNSQFVLMFSANSMYIELGFDEATYSGSNSYTSIRPINISGGDFIHIDCSNLLYYNTKINSTDKDDSFLFAKVYIDKPWGSTLLRETTLNCLHDFDENLTSVVMDINITDQYRRPLNLRNDWSIKLKLYKNTNYINF